MRERVCHLPSPPAKIFLVGVGGIGMSGLAQLLVHQGYEVAGSDRQMSGPGRDELFEKLTSIGIALFSQDGTGPRSFAPDLLVASAAVEEDNPDFVAAPDTRRLGRAQALASALNRTETIQIAVAGSCGKTSVTGWLGCSLRALGYPVLVVNGGYVLDFETARSAGNFHADPSPRFSVYEVDESDKSLVEFQPDHGLLLNIGADHYERSELLDVFGRFLDRCRESVTLPADLLQDFSAHGPRMRGCFATGSEPVADADHCMIPSEYAARRGGASFSLSGFPGQRFEVCQHGAHSAINAAAVAALLGQVLEMPCTGIDMQTALASFTGVRQRFELMGQTACGLPVYNDYAHNPDKIAAAIATAREAGGGGVLAFFQPHGFGPLGFMRDSLKTQLAESLQAGDRFLLLPVYYAGGSSSFRPTSGEVAQAFAEDGLPVEFCATRVSAEALVAKARGIGAVLVLGARDPSLPSWTRTLTECKL
ncbi:MAG: hypothetical protein KAI66_13855 [Lentisphaeria bacterium]|nr:hypothetical protein [Lentisphaeria bacterium]